MSETDIMTQIEENEPRFLKLQGLYGSFEIPESNFTLRYFSTFANNREKDSDHHKLLQELKPMRERLQASSVNDLGTLLQRDLDDARVSQDLVPYLQNLKGDGKHIAFFPSILAVLMPQSFLVADNAKYPSIDFNDALIDNYSNYWKSQYFPVGQSEKRSHLGVLHVNIDKTHVVVLDGQHRANAFRVMSNCFDGLKQGEIYAPFYNDIDKSKIKDVFPADLPVTLVWFEIKKSIIEKFNSGAFLGINPENEQIQEYKTNEELQKDIEKGSVNKYDLEIEPQMISRKLFVDVNNQAKKISASRTILLDDNDPSSLITKTFYSLVARNGKFESEKYSLLHSGFDINAGSSTHPMCISVPEFTKYSYDYFFFGSNTWDDLERYAVGNERIKTNTMFCNKFLPQTRKLIREVDDSDGRKRLRLKSLNNIETIESEFLSNCAQSFYRIYNEFCMYSTHIKHVIIIDELAEKGEGIFSEPSCATAWINLYKGGEGLYYVFKNNKEKSTSLIRNASKLIDSTFRESRSNDTVFEKSVEGEVDSAYKSINTKAFHTGLLKAFQYYSLTINNNSDLGETVDGFIEGLNKLTEGQWVHVVVNLRKVLIGGDADPKQWPAYQKLILSLVCDINPFNNTDSKNYSPEAIIYSKLLKEKAIVYAKTLKMNLKEMNYTSLAEREGQWTTECIAELKELYKPLKPAYTQITLSYATFTSALLKKWTL